MGRLSSNVDIITRFRIENPDMIVVWDKKVRPSFVVGWLRGAGIVIQKRETWDALIEAVCEEEWDKALKLAAQ